MIPSALILTLNEELNLSRCLNSLSWLNDIVILDSFSNDQTTEIARNAGVRIYQREFDNYAAQRNYALEKIRYKTPWLIMVDADEVLSPELISEIKALPDVPDDDITMYRIRRKDFFMGKWIRHSSGYPTWFGRLMQIGRVHIEREINEEYHTDGQISYLSEHFLHYPFNKGFHAWIAKHNRYSSMEAESLISLQEVKTKYLTGLFDPDPVLRRKSLKNLIYSLPGRPLLMFFALYFLKRGFLDGKAGLTFCLLRSYYEFLINCKAKELHLRKNNQPL